MLPRRACRCLAETYALYVLSAVVPMFVAMRTCCRRTRLPDCDCAPKALQLCTVGLHSLSLNLRQHTMYVAVYLQSSCSQAVLGLRSAMPEARPGA